MMRLNVECLTALLSVQLKLVPRILLIGLFVVKKRTLSIQPSIQLNVAFYNTDIQMKMAAALGST